MYVYIFTFYFGSICGCEARMTIWKIEGWGVSIEGRRQLLGVVKYWEVWSSIGRCGQVLGGMVKILWFDF